MEEKKAPMPPSAAELAQQSMESQLQLLPQQVAAEREFAPQFAQIAIDLSKRFAPQLLQQQLEQQREFAPQFAQATLAERDILTPEATAGQRALTDFFGGGGLEEFKASQQSALEDFLSGEEVLTDVQRRNLEQDIRGAQNVRGFGIASPLGAVEEAASLENLRQNIRLKQFAARTGTAANIFAGQQQFANIGLAAAGRQPAGFQTFGSTFQTQTPQLTSGLSGGQFASLASQQAQLQAQTEAANQAAQTQRYQAIGSLVGGIGGAFVGAPTAGASAGRTIGGLF